MRRLWSTTGHSVGDRQAAEPGESVHGVAAALRVTVQEAAGRPAPATGAEERHTERLRLTCVRRVAWMLPAALLAACGTGPAASTLTTGQTPECDRTAITRALGESVGDVAFHPQDLAESLPNVRHAFDADPDAGQPLSDSVVLGRVVEVVRHRGFIESGHAGTAGRPGAMATAYEDPAADWRTVRLTIKVTEVLAGPASAELAIDFGLMGSVASGEDDRHVECTFEELGEVVAITRANPSGPEFLDIPRQLADEPFGLATVDPDGRLAFPFAPGGPDRTSEEFAGGVDTIEKLRRVVRQPTRTVVHQG